MIKTFTIKVKQTVTEFITCQCLYSEVEFIKQNLATRTESVTPFLISFWNATIELNQDKLIVKSKVKTQTKIWLGGFNPFMSYTLDIESSNGNGAIGFDFSDAVEIELFIIIVLKKKI